MNACITPRINANPIVHLTSATTIMADSLPSFQYNSRVAEIIKTLNKFSLGLVDIPCKYMVPHEHGREVKRENVELIATSIIKTNFQGVENSLIIQMDGSWSKDAIRDFEVQVTNYEALYQTNKSLAPIAVIDIEAIKQRHPPCSGQFKIVSGNHRKGGKLLAVKSDLTELLKRTVTHQEVLDHEWSKWPSRVLPPSAPEKDVSSLILLMNKAKQVMPNNISDLWAQLVKRSADGESIYCDMFNARDRAEKQIDSPSKSLSLLINAFQALQSYRADLDMIQIMIKANGSKGVSPPSRDTTAPLRSRRTSKPKIDQAIDRASRYKNKSFSDAITSYIRLPLVHNDIFPNAFSQFTRGGCRRVSVPFVHVWVNFD